MNVSGMVPRPPAPAAPGPGDWRMAGRLALREMRGGLGALRLLFVCLFLGVMALAGVGSLTAAIERGLAVQGQAILGGDVEARLTQRMPTAAEAAALRAEGTVSQSVRMRAMGRTGGADGEARQLLVEMKAVDGRWPLYGAAALADGGGNAEVQAALQRGAVVAQALADQLGIAEGDRIRLGEAEFPVAGILAVEPDRAAEGFTLGPTVLVPMQRLEATGLVQPGSLYRHHSRIRLAAGVDPAAVTARLDAAFPEAGWRLADRRDGAPGVRRFVERLGQFLTLVSLTAMAVAGVGVGNGVRSWLDRKDATIATLKVLGGSSRLVLRTYLLLVIVVGVAAAVAGALAGALVPWVVVQLAGEALPVPPVLGLHPGPLALAIVFGLLVALAFAIPPLVRAGSLPAGRLFRGPVERWPWPSARALTGAAAIGALVVGLALAVGHERLFAAAFMGGAAVVLMLLAGIGWSVRRLAARAPRPRGTLRRMALGNLHRPGAQTGQLVVALGLGLSLFATLAFIETSFAAELQRTVPAKAPTFFVLDIPKEDGAAFRAGLPAGSEVAMVPTLRGPVTAVDGVPVAELTSVPSQSWILRGDRGLSFAAEPPAGTRIVAGRWWPADYDGPPLVSMDAEQAGLLGLEVGDRISVSVLGVEVEATIASLRRIEWDSLGFNFVLLFDPATLGEAPFTWMATVTPPEAAKAGFTAAVTRAHPTASVVRVDDVLGEVGRLMQQLGVAVRAAAAVAILAGIAVLVGALAAQARARVRENAILKALGATRRQLIGSAAMEYAALGAIVAAVALGIGALAAWLVTRQVLDFAFRPDWWVAVATVGAGAAVTLALGLVGAARTLGVPVNAVLREA